MAHTWANPITLAITGEPQPSRPWNSLVTTYPVQLRISSAGTPPTQLAKFEFIPRRYLDFLRILSEN